MITYMLNNKYNVKMNTDSELLKLKLPMLLYKKLLKL
jgi:hypothetical protein